ncbi:membrane-bound lytic murein transglycosylase MltF [Pseudobacteriovorax antillogorgiicola]|uniref:Membrane-bound lytic murein transglycosylase F n=1 Tax=Pseudobacteriovorax antillogorgiicola TaxID=1513793 RepID=A0A1Y6CBN4_9BACT|nr:membrane-bound lytic murein transglycosylase MltF [Pseudobacteriovorax antillogorgiicola]TCS49422.1 membrane-bound lytic murein transglycosylase F [Pseudobacteriovorax antillogorgiicola]SMF46833.1 membrane-bound lytic murein transglycosylase F [Pseudobacteriovorax antillogorgiicola]
MDDEKHTLNKNQKRSKAFVARSLTSITLFITASLFLSCRPMFFLGSDRDRDDAQILLENINEIIIGTRNAPTTYFIDNQGEASGFEYDLAKAFVQDLGRKATFKFYDTVEELLDATSRGDVHFAAAGLSKTPTRSKSLLFSPPYLNIDQVAVCQKNLIINDLSDLISRSVAFTAKSSHEETFRRLNQRYPAMTWLASSEFSTEQLLVKANDKEFDCVIADETIFNINQHLIDKLESKFVVDRGPIAWPIHPKAQFLVDKSMAWFAEDAQSDLVAQLYEKYFGSTGDHDYYDIYIFRQRIEERLPRFDDIIQEAADISGLDYTFLASVAYQESHWNPKSRSATGVRGFMMLTLPTARNLGVTNRIDPKQSMLAGAQYLKHLIDRFPTYIEPQDRRWFGLAAYNVGYYHVQDARKLAIDLGKNPNVWRDLKTILPLLADKKYYKRTDYGYARGHEPVQYVRNIRNYERVLISQLKSEDLKEASSH